MSDDRELIFYLALVPNGCVTEFGERRLYASDTMCWPDIDIHVGGWGTGYLGVPEAHPWYGCDVGALTELSSVYVSSASADTPEGLRAPDGLWWLAIDTDTWWQREWTEIRLSQAVHNLAERAAKAVDTEVYYAWVGEE